MKKLICILMAIMLIYLTACNNTSPVETDATESTTSNLTETEAVTVTEREYPDIAGIDFNGETYTTLCFCPGSDNGYSDGFYFDLDMESESGDILMDSIYKRNRNIEEMLNTDLSFTEAIQAGTLLSMLRNATMAGTNDYDLVVTILYNYPSVINEKLAYNLYDIKEVDFLSPWWDSKSIDELSIGHGLWGAVSDWTIADKMSSICIFFSKPISDDYDLDNHYQLIIDGDWTLDKMLENVSGVVSDVNGDGVMNIETDRFGILCDADFSYEMLHSAGLKVAQKDTNNSITLSVYGEREIELLQNIYEIMNQDYFVNRKVHNLTMSDLSDLFAQNQVLYFQHIPSALLELRQSTNDFGIIPVPKYTESQENYYTPVTHYAATFSCIPVIAANPENSAILLNLLAAESYYEVMPNLYDVVLDVKYTRDEESAQMLDIIFQNRIYDIGNICNFGGIADIILNLYRTRNIVSDLESLKNSAETKLDKFIQNIE